MKEKKKQNPIKVLYIVNHAVPYGANVALLNILDGVVSQNIVPMVVVGYKGVLCEELERRNIKYELVKHEFSIYPRLKSFRDCILFIPRLIRVGLVNHLAENILKKIAIEFKADLIHTNLGPTHIGASVAQRLKIPHVWHIREYQDLDFEMRPIPSISGFSRKLNSKNNYSIAITHDILKHFKMKANARIIYDGVSGQSHFQFLKDKENYFLFVGRLEDAKGIVQLIDAFIEFSKFNETHVLKIAGNGQEEYVSKLIRMADTSGLKNRIMFLGFRKDVYDLMARATALVVPSRSEGFGFITAEAMFNGCLVIGNNSGGTKEILEKEKLGILYSGQEELVAAMQTVVSIGIDSYFSTIKKAQEQAKLLYSKEQNVESIIKLYYKILDKKAIG